MKISSKNILVLIMVPGIILGLFLIAMLTFGTEGNYYVVISDSMIPHLNTGDVVILTRNNDSCSSFDCLKIGDIIVFEPDSSKRNSEPGKIIVHRIIDVDIGSDGQRVIRTKGDANPHSIQGTDYPITNDNYIGKVLFVIPYAGLLLMYLDLLVRIFMQPILYILMGSVVAAIFLLEHQKRKGV